MGKFSRDKGQRTERAIVHALQEHGFAAERWAGIPGFDQYEVSDRGRVRATSASLKGERIRKLRTTKNGYLEVNLFNRSKRNYQFRLVHRLVLLTFIGAPPSSKMQARHMDGDRTNNALTNLRWGTAKENAADKILHGTCHVGESTNSARLTEDDVRFIRRVRLERPGRKWGVNEIALKLGVSRSAVLRAAAGICWGHING